MLWPPIAVSVVCTDRETGSCPAVPIELFGEPLKPFPSLLRTCTLTFILDVATELTPRDAHCAAHQLVYDFQRNHARENRITKTFENDSYGLRRFENARIGLNFRCSRTFGDCLD